MIVGDMYGYILFIIIPYAVLIIHLAAVTVILGASASSLD